MKKWLLVLCLLLVGCSKVNSIRPGQVRRFKDNNPFEPYYIDKCILDVEGEYAKYLYLRATKEYKILIGTISSDSNWLLQDGEIVGDCMKEVYEWGGLNII